MGKQIFSGKVREVLQAGGVGVIPTDTIYGIVGSALNPKTVERIYRLRKREKSKPMIVLLGRVEQLGLFGVRLSQPEKNLLKKYWPGKVSVILPVRSAKFAYLHRGTKTIAFRLPAFPALRKLLTETGPLVAPSANWGGYPAALTIPSARKYFGKQAAFYVNVGELRSKPSTLVTLRRGRPVVLRSGAKKIVF